jgi:hypothetical protein
MLSWPAAAGIFIGGLVLIAVGIRGLLHSNDIHRKHLQVQSRLSILLDLNPWSAPERAPEARLAIMVSGFFAIVMGAVMVIISLLTLLGVT